MHYRCLKSEKGPQRLIFTRKIVFQIRGKISGKRRYLEKEGEETKKLKILHPLKEINDEKGGFKK